LDSVVSRVERMLNGVDIDTTENPFEEQCSRVCDHVDLDIAFLVDVSSSICQGADIWDRDGECESFKMQKSFIESLMNDMLDDRSTTGMMSWGTTVHEVYPFGMVMGAANSIASMNEMLIFEQGSTMTGDMTREYLEYLAPSQQMRVDRKQIVIIITDGVSTDDACAHASEFEEATRDFTIIIVAVGQDGAQIRSRLSCLQPDLSKYFMVRDYEDLDNVLVDIQRKTCPEVKLFVDSRFQNNPDPICTDNCAHARNGICEDGGVGSISAGELLEGDISHPCEYGEDCSDCFPREVFEINTNNLVTELENFGYGVENTYGGVDLMGSPVVVFPPITKSITEVFDTFSSDPSLTSEMMDYVQNGGNLVFTGDNQYASMTTINSLFNKGWTQPASGTNMDPADSTYTVNNVDAEDSISSTVIDSCESDQVDVAFLVDVSSSICQGSSSLDRDGECQAFKQQEAFIESLMRDILDSGSTTGMISWSTRVNELYEFNQYFGVDENVAALHEHLIHAQGATMTGAMIDSYLDFLAEDQAVRHESGRKQVVVLITDGVSTDLACQNAETFRELTQDFTIIIVAIGLDSDAIQSSLSCLQPDESGFVMAPSFENLASVVPDVKGQICGPKEYTAVAGFPYAEGHVYYFGWDFSSVDSILQDEWSSMIDQILNENECEDKNLILSTTEETSMETSEIPHLCGDEIVDVVFLVDVSSSICAGQTFLLDEDGECESFKMQELFLENIMNEILSEESTSGMISFATQVYELYRLEEHFGREENVNAMHSNLEYARGATFTGAMIERYLESLNEDQVRLNSAGRKQVVVIVTDGVAVDDPCQHADQFIQATEGFTNIVVAIGDASEEIKSTMSCLEADESRYVTLSSFQDLDNAVFEVTEQICPVSSTPSLDIAFLVDVSSSICAGHSDGNSQVCDNWTQYVSSIESIMNTILDDDSTTGMLSWSVSVHELYPYHQFYGVSENVNALHTLLNHQGGSTMTGAMIRKYIQYLALDQTVRANEGRPQVVLMLTDGVATDNPCEIADEFKDVTEDFTVIIVVISPEEDIQSSLFCLQPDATKFIAVSSYEELASRNIGNEVQQIIEGTAIYIPYLEHFYHFLSAVCQTESSFWMMSFELLGILYS